MKNIEIKRCQLAPSKGQTPDIIKQHFNWRKTGKYTGPNIIQIAEALEPIWWNRPLESDVLVKQEADGLYSYNLPYIGSKLSLFKTGYNILIPKNSISLIIQIELENSWDYKKLHIFDKLIVNATYNALLDLGVDSSKLVKVNNDLLFNGKKFMGNESLQYCGYYGGAAVITLNYTEEKEIFDRLTGKYAHHRPITGIIEENPGLFTKDQLINKLIEKILELLNTLEN